MNSQPVGSPPPLPSLPRMPTPGSVPRVRGLPSHPSPGGGRVCLAVRGDSNSLPTGTCVELHSLHFSCLPPQVSFLLPTPPCPNLPRKEDRQHILRACVPGSHEAPPGHTLPAPHSPPLTGPSLLCPSTAGPLQPQFGNPVTQASGLLFVSPNPIPGT